MKNKWLSIVLAATLFSGCSMRVIQPDIEVREGYVLAMPDTTDLVVNVEWWTMFGDTTLNRLIKVALANNHDLAAAASAVEQSRYSLAVARASFLPNFGVKASAEGEYTEVEGTRRAIEQEYFIQPDMSWQISLFGALKSSTDAARAEILSSEYAYRGVMLSLVTQVAEAYFQWLEYARSLAIAERSYALRVQEQAKIDSMYGYGFSSAIDLLQARGMTATAAADIPQYRRAMVQANLALNELLGQNPDMLLSPELTNSYPQDTLLCRGLVPAQLPYYVPVGLPSDLLERRPDVLKAYYDMAAAAAKVRYARAQRFPSVNLTASGGVLDNTVKGLFDGNPFYWNAIGAISQPIFSWGAARNNERIAFEVYRQSVSEYEKSVLTAVTDVEKALIGIRTYDNQLADFLPVLTSNCRLHRLTYELYSNGMTSYLGVIDAERNLYNAQLQYVQLLNDQLMAYVNLYAALGGGWEMFEVYEE
ncbi:MAG: efflux transporter outer membrane subunit [Tidjanibacter sp.]|nr:efflux transporter outer membrane subunit [Tidjanibacter sp.]